MSMRDASARRPSAYARTCMPRGTSIPRRTHCSAFWKRRSPDASSRATAASQQPAAAADALATSRQRPAASRQPPAASRQPPAARLQPAASSRPDANHAPRLLVERASRAREAERPSSSARAADTDAGGVGRCCRGAVAAAAPAADAADAADAAAAAAAGPLLPLPFCCCCCCSADTSALSEDLTDGMRVGLTPARRGGECAA